MARNPHSAMFVAEMRRRGWSSLLGCLILGGMVFVRLSAQRLRPNAGDAAVGGQARSSGPASIAGTTMCALESKNLDLCYSFVWACTLASETVRRSSRALGVVAIGRRPPRPDGGGPCDS